MGYNSVADIIGLSSFVQPLMPPKSANQKRICTFLIVKSGENSDKIWPYSSSRSSKIIDLGVNRKLTSDFLLVTNSNFGRICYRFRNIECLLNILEYRWIFSHPTLFEAPARGALKFCDEIWHQKTRIVGLPDGEEIMTPVFFFFVLTQYRIVTDRQTHRRTRCCRKYSH